MHIFKVVKFFLLFGPNACNTDFYSLLSNNFRNFHQRKFILESHIAFPKGLSFRCDVNGSSCDRRVEGAAFPIEISEKLNFISNSQISSSYNGCYTKN